MQKKILSQRRRTQAGFSLMELMIVLVVMGVLAAIIASNVQDLPEDARRTAAQTEIKNIELGLQWYQLDNASLPSTAQGLKALVEKPSGDPVPRNWKQGKYWQGSEAPKDPWGREYMYLNPGQKNPNGYDVFSLGKDGVQGGDDDIGNWK